MIKISTGRVDQIINERPSRKRAPTTRIDSQWYPKHKNEERSGGRAMYRVRARAKVPDKEIVMALQKSLRKSLTEEQPDVVLKQQLSF